MANDTIDRIFGEVDTFCELVVALTGDPSLQNAESACMQSRTVFGRLFPVWHEFREGHRISIERFLDGLNEAHAVMQSIDETEYPEALRHCFESTRCRAKAVEFLLDDSLQEFEAGEAAVKTLERLRVY